MKNLFCFLVFLACQSSWAIAHADDSLDWVDEVVGKIHYDRTVYAQCLLDANSDSKGLGSAAVRLVREACQTKATPKRCREARSGKVNACIAECKGAGMYSRKFGACSFN